MRKIRRPARADGTVSDDKSCLKLAAARLRHIAGTNWSIRKYMNMTPWYADQTQEPSSREYQKCKNTCLYRKVRKLMVEKLQRPPQTFRWR